VQNRNRNEYVTRDRILALLSDQEIASVSTAETAAGLADGEEYLDLDQLREGVRKEGSSAAPMGRVLPRKAVHEETWLRILQQLP